MKKYIASILFTLLVAIVAISPVSAADGVQKVKLDVYNSIKVANVTLEPGAYTFAVTVKGDAATVEISKGHKVVATVNGTYSAVKKFGYDAALVSNEGVASGVEGDKLKGTVTFAK